MDPTEAMRRNRERTRRATFARSAKSTLAAWVREGGDIRALNVATVTKGELRAAINAAKAEKGVTESTRIVKAQDAILAAVAREGPEAAREHLENVIEALSKALDELPDDEAEHAESSVIRTRVGVPTFREPPPAARVLHSKAA
jgi:hypothetical protein